MTLNPQESSTPSHPDSTPATPAPPTAPSFWQTQRENLQILGVALLLAVVIRFFIAEPRYIPSDSMAPTLAIGDRLVVEKVSYYLRSPEPGDIVVFDPPLQLQLQGFTQDQAFIKRIIGQPGDTVEIRQGVVYVNNQPLAEDYIAAPPDYDLLPVVVPQDAYFVLGDNRNNSRDSHVWGFLPRINIIGRAVFRFFPFDRLGAIPLPSTFQRASAAKSIDSASAQP